MLGVADNAQGGSAASLTAICRQLTAQIIQGHEFATVSGNLQDVLGRLSQREAQTARKLRDQVLADLDLLMAVCKGSSPPTNASRALMAAVAQGECRWRGGYQRHD